MGCWSLFIFIVEGKQQICALNGNLQWAWLASLD